jgi:hypothetical protein
MSDFSTLSESFFIHIFCLSSCILFLLLAFLPLAFLPPYTYISTSPHLNHDTCHSQLQHDVSAVSVWHSAGPLHRQESIWPWGNSEDRWVRCVRRCTALSLMCSAWCGLCSLSASNVPSFSISCFISLPFYCIFLHSLIRRLLPSFNPSVCILYPSLPP